MAQAVPYTKLTNFTQYATNNSQSPYNPAFVDSEFVRVSTFSQNIQQNLQLLQRDDGALRGGVVTPDTLALSTLILMNESSFNPRGIWSTGTIYKKSDIVTQSNSIYFVVSDHTSNVFATDLAANRLMQVGSNTISSLAEQVIYIANGGQITAGNVQNAIVQAQDLINTLSVNAAVDRINTLPATFTTTINGNEYTISSPINKVDGTRIRVRFNAGGNYLTNVTLKTTFNGVISTSNVYQLNSLGLNSVPYFGANHLIELEYRLSTDSWIVVSENPQQIAVTGQGNNIFCTSAGGNNSVVISAQDLILTTPDYSRSFRLDNFSRTLNLTTSGVDGFDNVVGEIVDNDFIDVYAILKKDGTESLIAKRQGTSGVEFVYPAELPFDYIASALVAILPVRTATTFEAFRLHNRRVTFVRNLNLNVALSLTSGTPSSYTLISPTTLIPEGAKIIYGTGGSPVAATGCSFLMSSNATGVANKVQITATPLGNLVENFSCAVPFSMLLENTSNRTIYYRSGNAGVPVRIEINGYDF